MANNQNLKHFTSENQPQNRGAKKGSKHISTIIRTMFECKANKALPEKQKDLAILKTAAAVFGKKPENITNAEMLIVRAFYETVKGDYRYFKDLMDRGYGQANQPIDLGNKDGEAFKTEEVGNKGLIEAIERQADVFRKLGRSNAESDIPEDDS